MIKKIYARILDGVVFELLETAGDIGAMFHSQLRWVDVTDVVGIAPGWTYDGSHFTAPVTSVERRPAE